jgi:hypothetical protein
VYGFPISEARRLNEEARWLNGSETDCHAAALGLHPAPPKITANSISSYVGKSSGGQVNFKK